MRYIVSQISIARLSYLRSHNLLNMYDKDNANQMKQIQQSKFDVSLCNLLAVNTGIASLYCNRIFNETTYTNELYTPIDDYELWLNNWPVNTLTEVKISDGSSYVTESSDNYQLLDERTILYPAIHVTNSTYGAWPKKRYGIQVTHTSGYDITDWKHLEHHAECDVPPALEDAVARMTTLLWMEGRADQSRIGIMTLTKGNDYMAVEKYVQGLPLNISSVLDKYRKIEI